jgi:hypothetical protein
VFTGGQIDRIEIAQQIGGVCYTTGGSRIVILSAGYLGSMLFGNLIVLISARTDFDKILATIIGAGMLVLVALYIRSLFGILFGIGFGCAMIGIGIWAPRKVNDILLRFLGITSALYAIIDIKDDLITRTVPGSDAYQISQILFLSPIFWGVFWILIALTVTFFTVKVAVKNKE